MFFIGGVYNGAESFQKSLNYLYALKAHKDEVKEYSDIEEYADGLTSLAFFKLNKIDSARYYTQECYRLDQKKPLHWYIPYVFTGDLYADKGDYPKAFGYYRTGLKYSGGVTGAAHCYNRMAAAFYKTGQADSAVYYSRKAI